MSWGYMVTLTITYNAVAVVSQSVISLFSIQHWQSLLYGSAATAAAAILGTGGNQQRQRPFEVMKQAGGEKPKDMHDGAKIESKWEKNLAKPF
jgi:hypothetical protein